MVLIVAFLVALFLGQGIAQDLKPCASGCVSGVFSNAATIGCAQNDQLCVCGKTEQLTDGIRDCVMETCKDEDPNAQLPLAQTEGANQCKSASISAGLLSSSTPTPSQPASPPPQTEPTSSAEQSPSNTPSVSVAETPSTPTSSPTPTSSAEVSSTEQALGASTTADPNASSSISGSVSAAVEPTSATHSSKSSATSGSAAASTESTSAEKSEGSSDSQNGLSVAARAGIGAGVGVAAVLLGILAFCLCMRRRKQKKAAAAAAAAPTMQISQPLPGSGRQYADSTPQAEAGARVPKNPATQSSTTQRSVSPITPPYSPSAASYSSELDANARRYEDMLPRTQPRTMI